MEHLDLFNDEVMKLISPEVICHIRAIHVVVQIYWGANCTVSVTDQNSENMHKKTSRESLRSTYGLNGLGKGDEHPAYASFRVLLHLYFTYLPYIQACFLPVITVVDL